MATNQFKSVDDYMAWQPASTETVLQRVRAAIRSAIPRADEVISYNMPAYKLDGEVVICFAGWKSHYALYAASAPLVAAFGDDLKPYKVVKGSIRFPLSEPVPVKLIEQIARFRAKERGAR